MSLVSNEQTKLTATALNNVAVAMVVVGALTPIVGMMDQAPGSTRSAFLVIGSLGWFLIAMGIHLIARRVLRSLKE